MDRSYLCPKVLYKYKRYKVKDYGYDPEKRKALKINKSTLWYEQKKIKEGKTIKMYNKTKVKIE